MKTLSFSLLQRLMAGDDDGSKVAASDAAGGASRSRDSAATGFLREPLVQFAAIGALVFAADAMSRPAAKDERVITVGKALRQSFIDNFDEDKARTPSNAELQKMIDSWVASEILYREGKALGVDRGDDMIRDRIAYKLQLLIFDQIRLPQATDERLRAWFEENRARFDEPERVGFYLTPPTTEAQARRWLDDIGSGRDSEELRDKTRAILARPIDSLAPAFGEKFRDALLELPQGTWAKLESKEGWHVVRLDSRRPGEPAVFENFRDEVLRLWRADETRARAWEAVNRLKASYTVRIEP
ncbi:peptidyl-prolyl cis-trans isomerase [Methylosinus sp. Ce-a6]|uniref:peptidylprolyl isomerase n=1 Tax=Methylosinus sp. Ce-a6 TaxID=2172005 RepID=UPI001FCF101F|nr:peptidylprolyl isomerase [Methylosinus sp. Ce-a6]